MKEICLQKVTMRNFKKFTEKEIKFGQRTSIFGQNYLGKSSVADLVSWVLFNKSATGNSEGSQFKPRRYDENGVNVDHVDVEGILELTIDGEETKIRKVQKQEWVRHHGDDFDSYTGDKAIYEWNDVTVSTTEHKKRVSEIVKEDIFFLLTNPAMFPSMAAKKQREFLLDNIARITDDDVFASSTEFDLLKAEMGNKTLEELIAKNKKAIDGYKTKQTELPIRIDQESKKIDEDVDFSKIEADLADNKIALELLEGRIEDTSKDYENLNALKTEKAELEGKKIQIGADQNIEHEEKKRMLMDAVDKASSEFNEYFTESKKLNKDLDDLKSQTERNKKELEELREQYKAEMSKELDESTLICPTCGQEFPDDKKEEIIAGFAEKKANTIKVINERGSRRNKEVKEAQEKTVTIEKRIEELKELKITAQSKESRAKKELDSFCNAPKEPTPEWLALDEKIAELDKKIAAIDTSDTDALKETLKSDRSEIQATIVELNSKLALKQVIEDSKATVEELRAELKKTTANLAKCEKLEKLINKFNKAKMDMLSERINDKFKLVRWKLFEKQKNGKYADVCVCMVHGSQYGENTTSATERMMAGMDIINTLQEIYEVKAPIFLDDADLYNEQNIPEMDCQLIKLCVSEDKELRIEVE